jgi:hypothetical protein
MRFRGWAGVLLSTLLAAGCSTGDKVDSTFDARVAAPAYERGGPRVLFDEAHHNWHRARKSYLPFTRLMESDGYRISAGTRKVTAEALRPYAVYVVANAVGSNERNDDPAFDDAECDAIRDWVASGGALLLITDHYPTGHAAQRLATRFGIELSKGDVEDSVASDPTFDPTHIVYSRGNGGLAAHPIVEGRNSTERIDRVLTFTGQALRAGSPSAGFLRLSPTAVARAPHPTVERRGGDVLVSVTYGDPVAVPGWSQGLALEHGKGRVVVLGEAAMLTARFRRNDGRAIGMNVPGYDNRKLALNVMHWLTRLL